MLSYEICETVKNTYFEVHLQTTASTSQAKNTAEAVTEFSKIETAEEEISHSMLDNYEVKNFKLRYLLNPIHHCKAENLKFSKINQKKLSRLKYLTEFCLNLCENYNFFHAYQGTLVTTVTCRYLALNFDIEF